MMRSKKHKRIRQTVALILALVLGGGQIASAQRPLSYSKDEPIRLDFDMVSIPEPAGQESGYAYDLVNGTVFQQVKQAFDVPRHFRKLTGHPKEAYNVNVLDEVPDSSWFTNRNGRQPLTLEEIKRGPNQTDGPAPGPLTVIRGKTVGVSPGFWVRDQRGDIYILKFDPPQFPEMATAAEVISTKLFYAIGYHVPQNTIFRFRREQLRMDAKASTKDQFGNKRAMTEADLDEILKHVARQTDGQYRCVASKLLPGTPKGGFGFLGVREDDPNDIIPHEHRRDVRGLRVFSAWLEHNDIRVGNTLDLYVREGGRQFIRHYLIDFGSTLGSDTVFPNLARVGHEYQLDSGEALKALLSLGIYQPPWHARARKLLYPSIGYYSAEHFNPPKWKQNFPLVAFENMTDRDGYWAAKIVGSFTDEQIAAAVETGELSDPAAARYLTEQLSKRRDRITRYYFSRQPALDRFVISRRASGFALEFADLRAELLQEREEWPATYEYELRSAAESRKLLARGTLNQQSLALSPDLLARISECGRTEAERGVARLTLRRRGEPQAAHLYLYYDAPQGALRLAGIETAS
jgi:hypothetical protein